jgi:hypothetical protein
MHSWATNAKRLLLELDAAERKALSCLHDDLKYDSAEQIRIHNDFKLSTIKKLSNLKSVLNEIQLKVQTRSKLNKDALKVQLENFDNKLTNFKVLMRADYDSLEETSSFLDADISKLCNEMELWDTANHDSKPAIPVEVTLEMQRRLTARQKVDTDRRAFVGYIDRQVNL